MTLWEFSAALGGWNAFHAAPAKDGPKGAPSEAEFLAALGNT